MSTSKHLGRRGPRLPLVQKQRVLAGLAAVKNCTRRVAAGGVAWIGACPAEALAGKKRDVVLRVYVRS